MQFVNMSIDEGKCRELISSAIAGDVENLKDLLLRTDVGMNYVPHGYRFNRCAGSALFHAIENSQEEVVEVLLRNSGVNINVHEVPSSPWGDLNPLCHAVIKGSESIARQLLEKRANVSHVCNRGFSRGHADALVHAVMACNEPLVRLILNRGDIELRYAACMPLLHCGIYYSSIEVMEALRESGANVSEEDPKGRSPLQFAIERFKGDLRICKMTEISNALLGHGAVLSFVDCLAMNPALAQFLREKWSFLEN